MIHTTQEHKIGDNAELMREVCRLLNRNTIGLELNPEYEPLIRERSMSHPPPTHSILTRTFIYDSDRYYSRWIEYEHNNK